VTGQTTASDIAAAVFIGVALFAAGLVPWLLLVDADHLLPRRVRELPTTARVAAGRAALTAAALLLVLTVSSEAPRA